MTFTLKYIIHKSEKKKFCRTKEVKYKVSKFKDAVIDSVNVGSKNVQKLAPISIYKVEGKVTSA